MSVELLQTLSLVAFILAGILLAVAVLLFFLLGIPKVIGDLTGITARKSIESIRQQNEGAEGTYRAPRKPAGHRPGPVDTPEGTKAKDKKKKGAPQTTVLPTPAPETVPLAMGGGETVPLAMSGGETVVLQADSAETPAAEGPVPPQEEAPEAASPVTVDVELGFISSAEVIE